MSFEHLALSFAYADAKGLPYETKTKQEIANLCGVSDVLIPPDTHSVEFEDFKGDPVGTWSDDTQHTLAMMRSIIENNSFNLKGLMAELQKEYLISAAGWGGASKKSMDRFVPGMTTESLRNMGTNSTGCGPLMRLAPLAIYQAFHTSEYDADIEIVDATTCTHKSSQAVTVSQTFSHVVRGVVRGQTLDVTSSAIGGALKYEAINNVDPILSTRLKKAYSASDVSDAVYETSPVSGETDAFAIWSVAAVAITTFDRHRSSGFDSVINAVIAEGGDTDSSAAIAAGLYMAQFPDYKLEHNNVVQLDRSDELLQVGSEFSHLVTID